jgi:PAS domain S-box-containing protein
MERLLKENQKWLAATLHSMGDAVIATDEHGNVVFMNGVAEAITGWTQTEARGLPSSKIFKLLDVHGRHDAEGPVGLALREGRMIRLGDDLQIMTKSGDVVPVGDSAAAIKDDQGRVQGMVLVFQDLTERKRMERELRIREERYRDLVENANDVICSLDIDGTITSFNRKGEEVTGYPRDDAIGMRFAQLVAPDHREAAQELVRDTIGNGGQLTREIAVLAHDGRRVMLEMNVRVIERDGIAVGVQGIARDVTERHGLEEQLRHAQRMEAVGRLAGGVAHDFNNLITVVTGHCDLALSMLATDDPVRDDVAEIRKAGDRAAALTKQLLAFSRKQLLEPTVLDLNEVVRETQKMLRRLIGEDVALHTDLDQNVGRVRADRGQLEQVIVNLAINARDAMPSGGTLALSTAEVELDEHDARSQGTAPGRYVQLEVRDTGVGMDEGTLLHLFEPFFTTKQAGTGLGLSTVYGIVRQSGGAISVTSSPGAGATFKMRLPRVDRPLSTRRSGESSATTGGSETILLVEDEHAVRKLASRILAAEGYVLLEARDGESALKLAQGFSGHIDLLLTDTVMPGMSGGEFAARFARLRPETKILFVSGYTEDLLVHHGVLTSGKAYLPKPFSPMVLTRKVREVLDG